MVSVNLLPDLLKTRLMVTDILGTYTLPERRSLRIRRLAVERFRTRPDLIAIYRFIDSLVEQGLRPEDFFVYLDGDRLASPCPGPADLIEGEEEPERLTYGELEAEIAQRLGDPALKVLSGVLRDADIPGERSSPISRVELGQRIDEVSYRLESLARRLDRTGLVTPCHGRVGRVSFLGRQLFEYRGRYAAQVTDAVACRMFEAHQRGWSLSKAARFAGVSRDTVRRWWGRAGRRPHRERCNRTDPGTVRRIVDAYASSKGDAQRTAAGFGVSPSTVYRYWQKSGLLQASKSRRLTPEEAQAVTRAHGRHEGNAQAAAKDLGLSPSTVRKYWRKAGLALRRPGRPRGGAAGVKG